MSGVDAALENTFARWGCSVCPQLDREDAGRVLAITIGLGALFNENAAAEKHWLRTRHQDLRAEPMTMILSGRVAEVLAVVDRMRGL